MSYDIVKPFQGSHNKLVYFVTTQPKAKPRIFKFIHGEGNHAVFYECEIVRKGEGYVPAVDRYKSMTQFEGKRTGLATYMIYDPTARVFLPVEIYIEPSEKFADWKVGTILHGQYRNGELLLNHFFKILKRDNNTVTLERMDTKKNGYRETPVKNQKNTQTIKVEIHDNPNHKGVAVIDGVWVKVWDGKEKPWFNPEK